MKINNLDEAIVVLKKRGHEIGDQAKMGNKLAQQVIDMYALAYKCPETASITFLCCALEDYLKDADSKKNIDKLR
ncbi:MAG TPA: hypothetical protein VIR31_02275 [Nitrososphaeraceae archaeon]